MAKRIRLLHYRPIKTLTDAESPVGNHSGKGPHETSYLCQELRIFDYFRHPFCCLTKIRAVLMQCQGHGRLHRQVHE